MVIGSHIFKKVSFFKSHENDKMLNGNKVQSVCTLALPWKEGYMPVIYLAVERCHNLSISPLVLLHCCKLNIVHACI